MLMCITSGALLLSLVLSCITNRNVIATRAVRKTQCSGATHAVWRQSREHALERLIEIVSDPAQVDYCALEEVADILDLSGLTSSDISKTKFSNGDNFLHLSIRRQNILLSQMMAMASPSMVNASSDDGLFSPLHLALLYGKKPDLVSALLEFQPDPLKIDRYGRTPLHLSVITASPTTIRRLCTYGRSARHIEDIYGLTPLDLASQLPAFTPVMVALGEGPGRRHKRNHRRRTGHQRIRGHGGWRAKVPKGTRLRCDVDVLNASVFSTAELTDTFRRYYANSRPVIIRGLVRNWKARDLLARRELVRRLGDVQFRVHSDLYAHRRPSTVEDEIRTKSVADFVETLDHDEAKQSTEKNAGLSQEKRREIMFDRVYNPHLANVYDQHPIFKICLAAFPDAGGLNFPRISVGGFSSGAGLHSHQSVLNGLVFGAKQWLLIPPNFANIRIPEADHPRGADSWQRLMAFLDDTGQGSSCTQLAGDLLFVPRNWIHATWALEESVGVSLEFCWGGLSSPVPHTAVIAAELYSADEVLDNASEPLIWEFTKRKDGAGFLMEPAGKIQL